MASASPYAQHGLGHAVAVPDWFLGFFFGIVALICFYELLVFSGWRRKEQRFFIGFLVSVSGLLAIIDGMGLRLLWPGRWAIDMAAYCVLFTLSILFANLSICLSLELKRHIRLLDRIFIGLSAAFCLNLGINLSLIPYPWLSNVYIAFTPILGILNSGGLAVTIIVLAFRRQRSGFWLSIGLGLVTAGTWCRFLRIERGIGPDWFAGGIYAGVLGFALCSMIAMRERFAAQERERQVQLVELAHADRLAALGILTSTMVHDLATPSATILNDAASLVRNMETLREKLEDALPERTDARGENALDSLDRAANTAAGMSEAAKRISGLLDDWRAFYHPEVSSPPEPMDMVQVAEQGYHLLEAEARNRRVIVAWQRPRSAIPVKGRPRRLGQAVVNLVLNAIHASAGGPSPRVEIELVVTGGEARLVVRDNGPGMDKAVLEKAGNLFYSTKGNGGSGLGLYIVKSIAKEHGGRLILESPALTGGLGGLCATLAIPLELEASRG